MAHDDMDSTNLCLQAYCKPVGPHAKAECYGPFGEHFAERHQCLPHLCRPHASGEKCFQLPTPCRCNFGAQTEIALLEKRCTVNQNHCFRFASKGLSTTKKHLVLGISVSVFLHLCPFICVRVCQVHHCTRLPSKLAQSTGIRV